jgi:Uma2 family endonuclease
MALFYAAARPEEGGAGGIQTSLSGFIYTVSMIHPVKFTVDDLDNFPDDGKRREIVEGELYVSPSPSRHHQRILRRLTFGVESYLQRNPVGEVFFAPFDVRFSLNDGVQPDQIYVANEHADLVTDRGVYGSPDWVVEILSPSNRDYDLQTKRRMYQKYGVRLYWVIDPAERCIYAWDDKKEEPVKYSDDDTAEVPLLPGLCFVVPELTAL